MSTPLPQPEPSRPGRPRPRLPRPLTSRRTASVLASAALAAVAVAGSTPPAGAAVGHDVAAAPLRGAAAALPSLVCQAATPLGEPITVSPPLTLQAHTVTMNGKLALTGCTSPNGTEPAIRSGVATFEGSANATCSTATAISGTDTTTWYDGSGNQIGTSTVSPSISRLDGYTPGEALAFGTVTGGLFQGSQVSGSATPTSDITHCAQFGLNSVSGFGTITVSKPAAR